MRPSQATSQATRSGDQSGETQGGAGLLCLMAKYTLFFGLKNKVAKQEGLVTRSPREDRAPAGPGTVEKSRQSSGVWLMATFTVSPGPTDITGASRNAV
jgi:hypothetical protein